MHIPRLIVKSMAEELNQEEQHLLEAWLHENDENQLLYQKIRSRAHRDEKEQFISQLNKKAHWQQLKRQTQTSHRIPSWNKIKIAATVLLLLGFGLLAYLQNSYREENSIKETPRISLLQAKPGCSQVALITPRGDSIYLSTQEKKEINIHKNIQVTNGDSGIVYSQLESPVEKEEINILRTPRGGEYQITLSDGSKIYLNAASELHFPIVFNNEKREIFLSGEAYFEVAEDSTRPFYVNTAVARLKVYGTSFNVKSYASESMKTILIKGKVGICGHADTTEHLLAPYELLSVDTQGRFERIEKVNPSLAVAWHLGRFVFENENLEEILSTLSRWYNVDFIYKNEQVKSLHFTAYMERYEDLSFILNTITAMVGVKFSEQEGIILVE